MNDRIEWPHQHYFASPGEESLNALQLAMIELSKLAEADILVTDFRSGISTQLTQPIEWHRLHYNWDGLGSLPTSLQEKLAVDRESIVDLADEGYFHPVGKREAAFAEILSLSDLPWEIVRKLVEINGDIKALQVQNPDRLIAESARQKTRVRFERILGPKGFSQTNSANLARAIFCIDSDDQARKIKTTILENEEIGQVISRSILCPFMGSSFPAGLPTKFLEEDEGSQAVRLMSVSIGTKKHKIPDPKNPINVDQYSQDDFSLRFVGPWGSRVVTKVFTIRPESTEDNGNCIEHVRRIMEKSYPMFFKK